MYGEPATPDEMPPLTVVPIPPVPFYQGQFPGLAPATKEVETYHNVT